MRRTPPTRLEIFELPESCLGSQNRKEWLRGLDSNQDNQIQSLVCCQLHHPGVVESQYFTDVLRSLQPKLSLNLYGSQAERPLRGEKNDWVGIATPSQNTRRQRDLIATGSSNQSC